MPGLAAVTPLPGTTDVIEIVEGITRPGAGNSGHQRALGLLVGQIGRVTEVLEVGQGAGGHELAGIAQVPLVDEILSLPVVEYGNIRLRLTLELGLVVTPLEPLNGIDIAARASGRENRRKSPSGSGGRRGRGGNSARPKCKSGTGAAHGYETHDAAVQPYRMRTDHSKTPMQSEGASLLYDWSTEGNAEIIFPILNR